MDSVTTEFCSLEFRTYLKKNLGTACMYCGSKKDVEYHHIIPRCQGGDNRLCNIVPLCRRCHAKAHKKRQQNFEYKLGRKKTPLPDNWEDVVRLYASGKITHSQAKELSGFKRSTFYREYHSTIEMLGIKDNRSHKIKRNKEYEV